VQGNTSSWESTCISGAFTPPAPGRQAPQKLACAVGKSRSLHSRPQFGLFDKSDGSGGFAYKYFGCRDQHLVMV
jgi:hypothetical protein